MNALTELKPARAALSAGILNPTTLAEALQMAEVISKSSIVPKDYQGNPGNVLVAIQWGMEIGLPPLQAMQNIAVINGRPSLWGDALLALCKASPLCEYITETMDGDTAICAAKRRGDPHPVVREFSVEDAKKAALYGKQGPWQQYPKRMLQMRARGYCLRDAFPDVLKGMAVAEEESDREVVGTAETTGPAPKIVSRTETLKAKINESLVKGRADWLAPGFVVGLKTTEDSSPNSVAMPAIIPAELPDQSPPSDVNPETGEVIDPIYDLLAALSECKTNDDIEQFRPALVGLKAGEDKTLYDRALAAWKEAKARLKPAA